MAAHTRLLNGREQLIAVLWNVWMGAGRQWECKNVQENVKLCPCSLEAKRGPALHVFSGPTTAWGPWFLTFPTRVV